MKIKTAINTVFPSAIATLATLTLASCFAAIQRAQAGVNIEVMTDTQSPPVYTGPLKPDEPEDEADYPQLSSAQSAIVIDQATGKVLAFLAPDKRRPMASTTKIMTALLVLEAIADGQLMLTTETTVSVNAGTMGDIGMGKRSAGSIMGDLGRVPNLRGQDRSMGLSPGDTISIQDLLYGLLLDSGNDAAIALAEAVAGTEAEFVEQMNERADQLAMNNTWYANPHGRDPAHISDCPDVQYLEMPCAHYSSVRDIARLARVALNNPLFSLIVSTEEYYAPSWSARFSGLVDPEMDISNKFIDVNSDFYKRNVFGVKTGTTDRAGRCLVSAADSQLDTSKSVIAVVLAAASDQDRYTDSALMLNYGLRALEFTIDHHTLDEVVIPF